MRIPKSLPHLSTARPTCAVSASPSSAAALALLMSLAAVVLVLAHSSSMASWWGGAATSLFAREHHDERAALGLDVVREEVAGEAICDICAGSSP